jgi:hypothetical protein
LHKTIRCEVNLDSAFGCRALSTNGKNLLLYLLCKSPCNRPSSEAALTNTWLKLKVLEKDPEPRHSESGDLDSTLAPGTNEALSTSHCSTGSAIWVSHGSSQQGGTERSPTFGSAGNHRIPQARAANDACLEEFVPCRPSINRSKKRFIRRMSAPGSQDTGKSTREDEGEATVPSSPDKEDSASQEIEDLLFPRTSSKRSNADGRSMAPSSLVDDLTPSQPSSGLSVLRPSGAAPNSRFRRSVN